MTKRPTSSRRAELPTRCTPSRRRSTRTGCAGLTRTSRPGSSAPACAASTSRTSLRASFRPLRYATALTGAITDFQGTPDDVADAVTARLERGSLLTEGATSFAIVLEETVLRYPSGDQAAMRDQLARFTEVMKLPRVSLAVIPFSAPRKMWP
ncbi:Scr1 family TA system antitoxin-like transcriptional regulator [Kitasatospora sp. CMC57]|uniref:Scr1 family TA system antitoxin-like transcriptional regulator n=1 Tax=Kitasatospora sp. CMC57 TaxID=3231513 RepID=UPI0038B58404